MFRPKFFKGGVNIPHFKNTENCETVKMGVPQKVFIPMLQHIGSICEPIVKKGEYVKVGQKIGESDKFISAPIHSSVSGVVSDIAPILYPGGFNVITIEIKPDGLQQIHEDISPISTNDKKKLLEAIRDSGLVGLGGAGFPMHVKLSPPKDKIIDTLIINAAECEPYITSDYRELIENANDIIEGIKLVAGLLNVQSVFLGIEDNKKKAIDLYKTKLDKTNIKVVSLHSRYPQGAEKMLIYALTKRVVPSGKLPSDVSVVVMNVNSASFLANYVRTGMPLIKKRVTVDGSAVVNPANVEVLIGTPLREVFEFCGGFKTTPKKVLMGGPMMGIAQFSLDTTIVKHTNAVLAFNEKDSYLPAESSCIRCGKCVEACPMKLLPLSLNQSALKNNTEEMKVFNIMDCIECGCCSYVCPAKRHLVQSIRLGKTILRNIK